MSEYETTVLQGSFSAGPVRPGHPVPSDAEFGAAADPHFLLPLHLVNPAVNKPKRMNGRI